MFINPIFLVVTTLPFINARDVLTPVDNLQPTLLSDASFAEPFAVQDDMAPGPWYTKLSYGFVTTESSSGPDEEIDFNEGYGIQLAFGRSVWRSETGQTDVSVELEALWRDQDVDSTGITQAVRDVNIGALMVNSIVDWHVSPRFDAWLARIIHENAPQHVPIDP